MAGGSIRFFNEIKGFKLQNKSNIRIWLINFAKEENQAIGHVNLIFCDDSYLLDINKKYLKHDYYTDVITFDNSDDINVLEGDIFISVERAKDNALSFKQDINTEIKRLIIHGSLHLVGYNDKSEGEKRIMILKENYYLSKLK